VVGQHPGPSRGKDAPSRSAAIRPLHVVSRANSVIIMFFRPVLDPLHAAWPVFMVPTRRTVARVHRDLVAEPASRCSGDTSGSCARAPGDQRVRVSVPCGAFVWPTRVQLPLPSSRATRAARLHGAGASAGTAVLGDDHVRGGDRRSVAARSPASQSKM